METLLFRLSGHSLVAQAKKTQVEDHKALIQSSPRRASTEDAGRPLQRARVAGPTKGGEAMEVSAGGAALEVPLEEEEDGMDGMEEG